MPTNWVVAPTCLPILRRCHTCASERFRASGIRVDATHKLLDAWLLVLCVGCGDTAKLTVLERMNARLHATRSAGPAARQRRRPDSLAASGSAHAMAQSHHRRLGQRLAPRRRRIGSPWPRGDRRLGPLLRVGRAPRNIFGPVRRFHW